MTVFSNFGLIWQPDLVNQKIEGIEKQKTANLQLAETEQQIALAKEKADRDREEAERLALDAKFEDMTSKERAKALTLDNQNRAARIALIDNELERATAQLSRFELQFVNLIYGLSLYPRLK